MNILLNRWLFSVIFPVCLLMSLQFPHLLCLIFLWLFLVCPLLISRPRTVHGLPTLYTCLILWLLPVCLFMSHCMTVHGLPAAYVSSYDCCQSASYDSSYDRPQSAYLLCLILWLFPVSLLLTTHLVIVPGLPIHISSYDSSWSTHCLCLTLWLFLICLLLMSHFMIVPSLPICMSHLMTVPSLSTSCDCSQSHLMALPCACYFF